MKPYLEQEYDHILFSYHGIPARHIMKSDITGRHCLQSPDCCSLPSPAHAFCYRHQCFTTTQLGHRKTFNSQRQVQHIFSVTARKGMVRTVHRYKARGNAKGRDQEAFSYLPGVCERLPGNARRNRNQGKGKFYGRWRRKLRDDTLPEHSSIMGACTLEMGNGILVCTTT